MGEAEKKQRRGLYAKIAIARKQLPDMDEEGYEMSHCISSYAVHCHQGTYRVFALKEPGGTKSTLGIWLNGKDGVSLDQHRGPHNSAVSRKAAAAAEKLLAAYRQAVTETL